MTESVHYELYGTLLFTVLAVLPLVLPIVLFLRWIRVRRKGDGNKAFRKLSLGCVLVFLIYVLVAVDAYYVEPNWPRMEAVEISGKLKSKLTVLHLSDLHIEKNMPRRERWLVEMLGKVSPDLIFITGDIHQTDNHDTNSIDRVLRHMKAPLGVFACLGYDNLTMLKQANTNIVYLHDTAAIVRRNTDVVAIVGSPGTQIEKQRHLLAKADYRIILEHTPDGVERAADLSADLYLCGHTHGGQVRIPFWGAIITNCETGKKYEAGLYTLRNMIIHTSRGLGLEPEPAPQVRFFCRPEITLINIIPSK